MSSSRSVPEGFGAWPEYWKAHGQPWRTEPEIDEERQQYLAARRAVTPDIERGIFPFQGIELSRADVEWLLATHEDQGVQGPVDLQDEQARLAVISHMRHVAEYAPAFSRAIQQRRKGPDLRGTRLGGIDLSGLLLARADLRHADLSSANLSGAELAEAILSEADLRHANLQGVRAEEAQLRGADLSGADLTTAYLVSADLEGAALRGASLHEANLENAHLLGADLREADLTGARLNMACLRGADLTGATLRHVHQLRDADLTDTKGLQRRGRRD